MGGAFLSSAAAAPEEGSDDDGPSFAVTVTSLGGESFAISGLQPTTRSGTLFQKVSTRCGLKTFEIKLCQGTQVITVAESMQTLQHLGLLEGAELTLVRRPSVHLVDPGISRYNSSYYCTVLRVEEVGFNELEIEIVVKGDYSAGALQDPSRSQLRCGASHFRPTKCIYAKDERAARPCSCVEATLTYEAVPMEHILAADCGLHIGTYWHSTVGFRFGSSGYTELVLNLADSLAGPSLGPA